MPPQHVREIRGRRRLRHQHRWKEFRFKSLKIAGPLLMVVNADRQANRAVVIFRKVGEASAGIHDIAIVPQMILARVRASIVWNGARRAVFAASPAPVSYTHLTLPTSDLV